jgi:hypothetical protein
MPTLIRFGIALLVLAALVFGSMIALAVFVNPTQKEIRVRIPAREFGASQQQSNDPLGLHPTPSPSDTETPAPEPAPEEPVDGGDSSTVTLPPPE